MIGSMCEALSGAILQVPISRLGNGSSATSPRSLGKMVSLDDSSSFSLQISVLAFGDKQRVQRKYP